MRLFASKGLPYGGGYALTLLPRLLFRPQEADGCGDAAAHDAVACGKGDMPKVEQGLLLRGGELVEGRGIAEVVPFSDIVPVVVVPIEIAGQDTLPAEFRDYGPGRLFRGQEPAEVG